MMNEWIDLPKDTPKQAFASPLSIRNENDLSKSAGNVLDVLHVSRTRNYALKIIRIHIHP